jgi:hypothetical protein
MRKFMLVFIAFTLATPALADAGSAVPQFDVTQTCRATSNLGLADEQSFATCLADETDARKQLASKWSSYSGTAKSTCSAETRIGGDPSYVELSVCLDFAGSVTDGSARKMGQ